MIDHASHTEVHPPQDQCRKSSPRPAAETMTFLLIVGIALPSSKKSIVETDAQSLHNDTLCRVLRASNSISLRRRQCSVCRQSLRHKAYSRPLWYRLLFHILKTSNHPHQTTSAPVIHTKRYTPIKSNVQTITTSIGIDNQDTSLDLR